jgi:hypothetical protein
MSADQRLADLGLTLPSPPKPIGNYVPFRLAGNLLLVNMIAAVGTLERVDTVLKVLGMVNAGAGLHPPSGGDQLCADLLVHVLGEGGRTSVLGGRHGQPAA